MVCSSRKELVKQWGVSHHLVFMEESVNESVLQLADEVGSKCREFGLPAWIEVVAQGGHSVFKFLSW